MTETPASGVVRFIRSFTDLLHLPRAFWFVIGAFVVESMAYFGILTLMTRYYSIDLGWRDTHASWTVATFTALVTLFMLGVGSYAESFGLRKAILAALVISAIGRALFCLAPETASGVPTVALILISLLMVAIGSGILQPVCYSGVKQYTDEKTNSMGYALIYALMNFGIFGMGAISAWIRPAVDNIKAGKPASEEFGGRPLAVLAEHTVSGVHAVNWVCTGTTILTLILFAVLMTRKTEAAKIRPDRATEQRNANPGPLWPRVYRYFADGPFSNTRFLFFIFMLLPVRTLFAHLWLTLPDYVIRAYPKEVGDRMEWLVEWINSMVVFFGVPIATALTRHVNVYRMMVVGTLVSAAPTFLLAMGPNLTMLITYLVVFSIGEALWSARFYEYASELAPEGKLAQYMGMANIPWLLAKFTTGLYSGLMLEKYCPKDVSPDLLHTEKMWFIYGCIAMMSPIGLWLAREWVMAGLHTSSRKVTATTTA